MPRAISAPASGRVRRRQLPVSLLDDDHEFLVRYAEDRDKTIAVVLRRVIRQFRRASEAAQTASVPHAAALARPDRGEALPMGRRDRATRD